MKNHPTEAQLALYSGGDLGFWETRGIRDHVSECAQCRQEIQALQLCGDDLREVTGGLPGELNWTRLSQEMTGNIRVGLAAGEAIEGFERSRRPVKPRLLWNSAMILACTVVAVVTFWASLPNTQLQKLVASVSRIRLNRIGTTFRPAVTAQDSLILEATPSIIQVKVNGHALSLLHPHSDSSTVSINMQDSAGVRYVDDDTGQVTIDKVYYAQ